MEQVLNYSSAAASTIGFASNVTGASWALTATDCGDSLAHKVTINNDAATDHSGKTATLVGTGANGEAVTETLALPAGTATVTSTNYFKTLTSVTPSATIGADTMDIGWAAASISPQRILRADVDVFNVGIQCTVSSGSPTYTLQYTLDGVTWNNHATIASKNASFDGGITSPVKALRMSWAAAGGVNTTIIQAAKI